MNKKMLQALGMYAAVAAMSEGLTDVYAPSKPRFNENNVSGKLKGAPDPKGLKRFEIDGKVVYAINEKNAIRKAKNDSKSNSIN